MKFTVRGKRNGDQANPDRDTFMYEGRSFPDIFEAIRAALGFKPGRAKVAIEGDE
jgi:hypothetical protein